MFNYDKTYYMVTNEKEDYYGMIYTTGLNQDHRYNPKGESNIGGIYFSDIYFLPKNMFLQNSTYIREVSIPEDARVYKETERYKSDKALLSERKELWTIDTINHLESLGMNIHCGDDCILQYAACRGMFDIVKYLMEERKLDHTKWDYIAAIWARENGHIAIARYIENY